jgi:hypothetical protein
MQITNKHRKAAKAIWQCGGRLEEAAAACSIKYCTLHRWLGEPEFRTELARASMEPLLQATSAVMRWAPAAVARLIRDLDGDSPVDARQAAREILKLAVEAHERLTASSSPEPLRGPPPTPPADDPYSRRIANLPSDRLEQMLKILNGEKL